MSIESARNELQTLCDRLADGADSSFSTTPRIDRLILEVQAAMPCYDHWTERIAPTEPCESCKAREKLKVPA